MSTIIPVQNVRNHSGCTSRDPFRHPPWSPASAPISGLVCGLPSKKRGSRLMLMLKAFIDDSHSGPTGPVFVLAGYISTAEKWASFAEKWQAILGRVSI